MTERLRAAEGVLLRLNLLVLLAISFLPFPTHLMAEALGNQSDERVYVTVYGLVLLSVRLTGALTWGYARRAGLVLPTETSTETQAEASDEVGLRSVLIGYAAAITLGLVVPYAAVALYGLLAVALVVPVREARAALARGHRSTLSRRTPLTDAGYS